MTKPHQPTAEEVAKVVDFLDSRPDAWRCFADHPPIMRDIARHAFAFVHGFRADDEALQAEWKRQLEASSKESTNPGVIPSPPAGNHQ